jgi:hypothetical protein
MGQYAMALHDELKVRAFIDELYDNTVEPEGLNALGTSLAEITSATSSCLNIRQDDTIAAIATANVEAAEATYIAYYQYIDPWLLGTSQTPMTRARFGEELIAPQSLRESEFYCDFASRFEIFHMLTAYMPLDNGNDVALGLHRSASLEPFAEQ